MKFEILSKIILNHVVLWLTSISRGPRSDVRNTKKGTKGRMPLISGKIAKFFQHQRRN